MTAPVRVEITVDKDILAVVLEDLDLSEPPSLTLNGTEVADAKGAKWGEFDPAKNHITVFTLPESFQRMSIGRLTRKVRDTLLHELRHAHQHTHWSEERIAQERVGPYRTRGVEKDARRWALKQANKYPGLVRVRRLAVGAQRRLP